MAFSISQTLGTKKGGFTLLFALLIVSTLLVASSASFSLLVKELKLARFGPEAMVAFYSAESGANCAFFWSVHGVDLAHGNATGATCNGQAVTLSAAPGGGYQFSANWELGCATVLVRDDGTKTLIQARGYNTCPASKIRVERGVQYIIARE